jgi:hypothetical protein
MNIDDKISSQSPRSYVLWRLYEANIKVYTFYMELIVKSGIFVFALTGAITSYYFANQVNSLVHLSLILPIVFNAGLFFLTLYSIPLAVELHSEHEKLEKTITSEISFNIIPLNFSPLANTLRLFSLMYGLVSGGLILLLLIQYFWRASTIAGSCS